MFAKLAVCAYFVFFFHSSFKSVSFFKKKVSSTLVLRQRYFTKADHAEPNLFSDELKRPE